MSRALGHAEPLHLRLFIENIEVPVIGALVSASENSPAVAQIEMVPAHSALDLAPRSKVLLFFLDPGDADLSALQSAAGTPTTEVGDRELTSFGYRLLFSGEVFSISFSKVGFGSRSVVLRCLDDSNLWDTTYLYSLSYSPTSQESVVAGDRSTFLGLTETAVVFDDILSTPQEVIRQTALRQRAFTKSLSNSTGMLGGLLALLELIGGVAGKYIGVTAWSTVQEARVRLLDQIGSDSGDTAQELFDLSAYDGWLMNTIGAAGGVISFRDLINIVCQYIYYGVVPNPVGAYRLGDRDPPTWPQEVFVGQVLTSDFAPEFAPYPDQILQVLRDTYKWDGKTVMNGRVRPRAYVSSGTRSVAKQIAAQQGTGRGSKPKKSAHLYGYAADFSLFNEGIGFKSDITPSPAGPLHARLKYWAESASSPYDLYSSGHFTEDEVRRAQQIVAFYNDLRATVKTVGNGALNWGAAFEDAWLDLVGLSGAGGDPVHVSLAGWQDKAKASMRAAAPPPPEKKSTVYDTIPDRERLITQIFRPDVWFVPPPACNVIFPEEAVSLNFSRDMMRETTRLQLTSFNGLVGDDVVLNPAYFVPKIENVESLSAGGLGSAAKSLVYPHEKYTGIIPKIERISDLAFYARLSTVRKERLDPETETADASHTGEGEASVSELDEWAKRTAAFTFLSYRYSARSLDVGLKFTPRLVCGFPALVLDRTAAEQLTMEERQTSPLTPNHFLGMIRSLTHTVSQGSGSTSVSLSHVRSHKTKFDDLFAQSVYDNSGLLSIQVRSVNDEPFLINLRRQDDSLKGLYDEEFSFCRRLAARLEAGMDPAQPTDLLGPNGVPLLGPLQVIRHSVVQANGGVANEDVEVRNLETDAVASFPFLSVAGVERGITSYLPIEEAIRPPWVSDEYSNENIGTLYQQLFGCPSIMDLYSTLTPGTVNGVPFTVPSVSDAVEKIVDQYSRLSDGGYLASAFIREVTSRDFASIDQVIGGFYSQTSGDFEGLEGSLFSWMTGASGTLPTTQIRPDEANRVPPELDARRERWQRARTYRDDLLRSVGLRG